MSSSSCSQLRRSAALTLPIALAALLLSAAASWGHTDPPGATLTAVDQALGIYVDPTCSTTIQQARGSAQITSCETVYLQAQLGWVDNQTGAIAASFEGGAWKLLAAGNEVADLAGGDPVPCIGDDDDDGDPLTDSQDDPNLPGGRGLCAETPEMLPSVCVAYTPTAFDVGQGFVLFEAKYGAFVGPDTAYAHIGTNDLPGVSNSVPQFLSIIECAECETCTPGACVPDPVSTPCTDTDGDLCTIAGCDDQGSCNQEHETVTCVDGECFDEACNPATGVCDRTFEPFSTPCDDTDGSLCTIAGCDGGGVCNQTHEEVTCVDGVCFDEECDPATGECERTCAPDGIDECEITIGDFIWDDIDGGGDQNDGATGIEDVTVNLLDCSTGQDQLEASTTTVPDGFYSFTVTAVDEDCMPTSRMLLVEVDDSNFDTGAPLEQYVGTIQDNTDDAFDSDCHPLTHRTACTEFFADDGTIDCGFTAPCEIEVEKTCQVLIPADCDTDADHWWTTQRGSVDCPPQPEPSDVCEAEVEGPGVRCDEQPEVLWLRLGGGDCQDSSNTQDPSKWSCAPPASGIDPLLPVTIYAAEDGNVYLNMVQAYVGDVLELAAADVGRSELDSEIGFQIYQGGLVQEVTIHTSCSQDLRTGDTFGALEVWAFDNSQQGYVALGAEVLYRYTVRNVSGAELVDVQLVDYPVPGDPFTVPGSPVAALAPDEEVTLSAVRLIEETTSNEVMVSGSLQSPTGPQCFGTATALVTLREPPFCPRTPGYWKNHPEAWPAQTLELGGVEYDAAQLMEFLEYGGRDVSSKLARHLVATKFNLLAGSDPAIQPVVDEADAFLAAHPPGSDPRNGSWWYGLVLKNLLDDYNNSGHCD